MSVPKNGQEMGVGDWGLGVGVGDWRLGGWGLEVGDWGLGFVDWGLWIGGWGSGVGVRVLRIVIGSWDWELGSGVGIVNCGLVIALLSINPQFLTLNHQSLTPNS
jgi:hypothetical protein